MISIQDYKNKNILVLGLAKSGIAAAKLLHRLGANVTINDAKPLSESPEINELLEAGIQIVAGSHPIELLDQAVELVVKNPGIPYTNSIVEKALEKEIPVITEVELASQVSEATFLGITGTNGKTTTTTMIHQIFELFDAGKGLLSGNIGYPASDVVTKANDSNVLITELSSFQLMGMPTFKPEVAIITNIYEAHIDYHGTRDEYVKAKWNIQKNMTSDDYLILNADQEELVSLSKTTEANVIWFSSCKALETGSYVKDKCLMYNDELIMEVADLGVPGSHNIENALAAIAACKVYNIPNSVIKQGLSFFTGVKHRTEFIGVYNDVKVYNDSKATNILATQKALSGFNKSELVLIAGGLDRGNGFDALIDEFKGIYAIILLGETKNELKKIAEQSGIQNIILVDTMSEAVEKAFDIAKKQQSILLSPACASWDMYANFELRGDDFVSEIKKQVGNQK